MLGLAPSFEQTISVAFGCRISWQRLDRCHPRARSGTATQTEMCIGKDEGCELSNSLEAEATPDAHLVSSNE